METCNLIDRKIIEDCRAVLSKKKIAEEDADVFVQTLEGVLSDYRDILGEDKEIRYQVRKRIDKVECKIFIKADRSDPFEEGKGAEERNRQKTVRNAMMNRDASLSYRYSYGYNIVTIQSARKTGSGNILKQPMVIGTVAGLIVGLLCQQLPQSVNQFIVNDITSPGLTIALNIMAGIMGPVIFFTIVKAVSILDSIDDLTGLGSKVLLRFLKIVIYIAVISCLIGILFFPLFGNGSAGFSSGAVIGFLFDLIPTSLVSPFVENNIPQLVILAIGMGAVLLKLGDRVKGLTDFIDQLAEWLVSFMDTILIIMPAVAFLSILNIVAKGQIATFIRGWKFIAACYVCMALCFTIKLVKVSTRCKISIPVLWKKTRPVIMKALSTGSSPSTLKLNYKVAREDLGIDPDFSAFWIPLSNGMLDTTCTMFFVLAPFLIAEITGTPVSVSFLVVLILLSVELSMASPGLTAGYMIIFQALGMSVEYVGMFSAFSVVTRNCSAACCTAYRIFEHIEMAWMTENIDMSYFDRETGQKQ